MPRLVWLVVCMLVSRVIAVALGVTVNNLSDQFYLIGSQFPIRQNNLLLSLLLPVKNLRRQWVRFMHILSQHE